MKLPRMLTVAVTTMALVGLAIAPSSAADETRVVRSLADDFGWHMPPAYEGFGASCSPDGEVVSSYADPVIEKGPAPVPLGSRTWGFDTAEAVALGPWRLLSGAEASTAELRMQVYSDTGTAQGVAFAEVRDPDGYNPVWRGVAHLAPVAPGSWQTAQATGATTYTWRAVGGTGQFNGTISEMLTQVGEDRPVEVGLGFGCDPAAGMFHLDDARIGAAGDVVTWDFEGATSTVAISDTLSTVTAGGATSVSGVLNSRGDSPGDLVLEQRDFGSDTWVQTTQATPARDHNTGVPTVTYVATPLRQTSYRWRYPENEAADGSVSDVLTVEVHSAVEARAPRRVKVGSKVRVTGSVLPRKPGQRVRLWRGQHLLGTARVNKRGNFKIRTKAAYRGRLRMVAKVGRSDGNLAGQSGPLVVHVR